MLSSTLGQKTPDMDGKPLFSDGLVMPLDFDPDYYSDFFSSSDHPDDDKTVSTASSPITPSSDISALFPSWNPCLPEPVIDLSSWDATPEWIRNSSRLPRRSFDFNNIHFGSAENSFSHKKRRHNYQVPDSLATPPASEPPEPIREAPKAPDMPLRFVEITPDNILSGDIHRAQGEWKRGRPRINKSNSKPKSNKASSPSRSNWPGRKASPAMSTIGVPRAHTTESYNHSLFQPVFDHLLVTDMERDFFSSLFA